MEPQQFLHGYWTDNHLSSLLDLTSGKPAAMPSSPIPGWQLLSCCVEHRKLIQSPLEVAPGVGRATTSLVRQTQILSELADKASCYSFCVALKLRVSHMSWQMSLWFTQLRSQWPCQVFPNIGVLEALRPVRGKNELITSRHRISDDG